MSKSEQNRAPVEAQFFEDVDALVREAIQNSLDAGVREVGKPVRVRFFVSNDEAAVPSDRAAKWLIGLHPHLEKVVDDLPDLTAPMPFVSVEDFNTRGLEGRVDVAREVDLADGERADFFYFWRNVGITGKSGNERGSWGLGKAVYCASSRIHSMLGWSIRQSKPSSVLMGQAGLRLHALRDSSGKIRQHDAYGFYGQYRDPDDQSFATPTEDPALIDAFRDDFHLKRDPRNNYARGLSLVIPFPREEFLGTDGLRRLTKATVLHFAFPLIARQLEVDICSPNRSHCISADTVEEVLSEIDWRDEETKRRQISDLLDLTRWALTDASELVQLGTNDTVGAALENLEIPKPALADARARFLERRAVGFQVPVIVRPKNGERTRASFRVFLQQRESSVPNAVHFIRQGLTITEVAGVPGTGLTGIVLVDDNELSRLLRDSENPAHTRWNPRSEKLKSRYHGGPARIELVTGAPRWLLRRLIDSGSKVDTEMLADFFPEPAQESAPKVSVGGKTKGKRKITRGLPPTPPPKPITISRIDGGFSITRRPEIPLEDESAELLVEVAYDCVGADPFNAWEEFDFQFGKDLTVEVEDGTVVRAEGNRLRLRPGQAMRARVTGFSPTRDVIVRHRWTTQLGSSS
ncbi:MAG: hypothetical protein AB1730_20755 [Myxococcota bacterium]